jgi:hypothetical protein
MRWRRRSRGLGAEQYLRIEEMWRRDQQEQWQARAGQQQAQAAA